MPMQIGYPVARLMIVALLLILCGTGSDLTAQYTSLGTDFTFGFLQNRTLDNGRSSTGGNGDVRVAIYVSNHSGRGPATVEISYSGADGAIEFEVDGLPVPSDGTTISVEVAPLSGRLVEFVPSAGHTPADLQIMGNGRRDRRSYRVRSDEPIALYAQSWQSASRDVSLILPKPSLGSDYVVAAPHPTPYARSRYGGPTEFAIVAVDDNTSVRFSLPRTVTVRLPGQPAESYPAGDHVIRLDAGETWQLQSDSLDLTGIRVHADDCRPFALYAGNMAVDVPTTSGGTWDHVYEQMFPRRSWGRRYVTTPVTDGVWDLFKIISAIDNTTVRIDGLELRTAEGPLRLAAGEVLEISDRVATSKGQVVTNAPTRIDRASYITSSAPVAVAQIGLSSAMHERSRRLDPFMIILSPIEQRIDSITFASLPASGRFLNIVAHELDLDRIFIESEGGAEGPITDFAPWQPVGASPWRWAKVDLANDFPPGLTYRLTGRNGAIGFNAYIYGLNNVEGYGYAAGVNLDPLRGRRMIDQRICAGDAIRLEAPDGTGWRWNEDPTLDCNDCPNPVARPDTSTRYIVTIERGCVMLFDTVEVTVDQLPVVQRPKDTTICAGTSVAFDLRPDVPDSDVTYEWEPGPGISCTDCPDPEMRPTETTTYRYRVENLRECVVVDSVMVTVLPLPQLVMSPDTTICRGASVRLPIRTIGALDIAWDPSDDLDCLDCDNPTAQPEQSMTYAVTLTGEGGCTTRDSVRVTMTDFPVVALITDTTLCDAVPIRPAVTITGATTVRWTPEAGLSCNDCTDPVVDPGSSGTWRVTATGSGGCTTVDSVTITRGVRPTAEAGDDQTICIGDTISIGQSVDPGIDGLRYSWSPSTSLLFPESRNPLAFPSESTMYRLIVTGPDGGCTAFDSVEVAVSDSTILQVGLAGATYAETGRRLSVPVVLRTDPANRVITDVTASLRFDHRVMVLEPAAIAAGLQQSLLTTWSMEILTQEPGLLRLRFEPGPISATNARLQGIGTLFPIVGRVYLGPVLGSEVAVTVTTTTSCTRFDEGGVQINIDSICATAHRLVDLTNGRLRPPSIVPNPVLDEARISFEIPVEGPTRLALLDALGREVDLLVDRTLAEGVHELDWSSGGFSAGLYTLRLSWSGVVRDVRLVVQ